MRRSMDSGPAEATATRRQRLATMLRERDWGFDELRRELQVGGRELEAELSHLQRSLGRAGGGLDIWPARCHACGFQFRPGRRPYHAPRRCPRCREERVEPPRFAVRR